jgi:hypothetical protein
MDEPITDETLRRALGLAAQILDELPKHLRPRSDIEDMRRILDGRSTGRDGYIIARAIATALAFRAIANNARPLDFDANPDRAMARFADRVRDFRALFEAAKRCDATAVATCFAQAIESLSGHDEARPTGGGA